MRVTFLGTGTSVGVPRIACDCPVCSSTQPENKRLRCSILIEHGDRHILVDTSPDLRTQALTYRVDRVDAVLFTHGHADHLHGLDDVRIYCFQRDEPLPCYGDAATLDRIRRVFDYVEESFALRQYGWPLYLYGGDRKVTYTEHVGRKEHYHHPRCAMRNLLALERMIERGGAVSDFWSAD